MTTESVAVKVRQLSARKRSEWQRICSAVVKAAPPTVEVTDRLLDDLRDEINAGRMSAWSFSNGSPIGVALTSIREDRILGRRDLLVYAAAADRKISYPEWEACFQKLKAHALSQNCTHITAYSNVQRIAEVAAAVGGDADTRYISIPLGGNHV